MKTIDFDLEKAKSGEYEIVTENGMPVRIVCWDKQDGVFKIVGLVKNSDGYEFCQSYDEHGSAHEDDTGWKAFDLRLVCPDPDPVSELQIYKLALEKYWRPSDKSAVCDIRYTVQDNVIYDCVGGKEMPICDVVNVVVNALNHRNDYWDERSATIHDLDVINEHITDSRLSDEVNTRLNKCGWFVCDRSIIKGLIDRIAEIEKNM
jgi:hypothetical protein